MDKETYWELCTAFTRTQIKFYTYCTGTETKENANVLEMVESYKKNKYPAKFVHWEEVTKEKYLKALEWM